MKKQKTGNNGFTLAELLIDVAIIGVLVAISMLFLQDSMRKAVRRLILPMCVLLTQK